MKNSYLILKSATFCILALTAFHARGSDASAALEQAALSSDRPVDGFAALLEQQEATMTEEDISTLEAMLGNLKARREKLKEKAALERAKAEQEEKARKAQLEAAEIEKAQLEMCYQTDLDLATVKGLTNMLQSIANAPSYEFEDIVKVFKENVTPAQLATMNETSRAEWIKILTDLETMIPEKKAKEPQLPA